MAFGLVHYDVLEFGADEKRKYGVITDIKKDNISFELFDNIDDALSITKKIENKLLNFIAGNEQLVKIVEIFTKYDKIFTELDLSGKLITDVDDTITKMYEEVKPFISEHIDRDDIYDLFWSYRRYITTFKDVGYLFEFVEQIKEKNIIKI